jgi:hypothetical protein
MTQPEVVSEPRGAIAEDRERIDASLDRPVLRRGLTLRWIDFIDEEIRVNVEVDRLHR